MTTVYFEVAMVSELRPQMNHNGVSLLRVGAYMTNAQMKGVIAAMLEQVPAQEFIAWMDELFPELVKTNVNEELLEALRGCLSLLDCYVVPEIGGCLPQCMTDAKAVIAKASS